MCAPLLLFASFHLGTLHEDKTNLNMITSKEHEGKLYQFKNILLCISLRHQETCNIRHFRESVKDNHMYLPAHCRTPVVAVDIG